MFCRLRDRAHVALDRERESDRMPGRRIRVLTDDEHPHLVERGGERAQHVRARGEVGATGRDLRAQQLAHPRHLRSDRFEGCGPARVDQFGEGPWSVHVGVSPRGLRR